MKLLSRIDKPVPAEEKYSSSKQDLNGILGRGSIFEGKLVFEGTVHLNGTFSGEIHSKDTLIVGEGAKVQGEIDVGTLIIHGEISGKLRASQLIEMHAPARVKASISTPVLVIDRGVIFEGQSQMEELNPVVAAPPLRPAKVAG